MRGIRVRAAGDVDPPVADEREQARRDSRLRTAMASSWEEIPRDHIKAGPLKTLEDERSGRYFCIMAGEVDGLYCSATAYYFDQSGSVIFLEPAPIGSRDELEARRAARDAAAAARRKPRVRR